jgi:hypothetical protein
VKLDFSAINFKSKVTGWRLSIEKKADTLFPMVCDTARGIAGIAAADLAQSEHHDPQILARANLASEDEDSAAEHEKDNDRHDLNDYGVDNGNNSGVDEIYNNGGNDLYVPDNELEGNDLDGQDDEGGNLDDGHVNKGGDLDVRDSEADNRIGSEEEEGMAGLSMNGGDHGDHNDEEENDVTVDSDSSDSDLTDISSNSDVVQVVPAPRSSRTEKKRV